MKNQKNQKQEKKENLDHLKVLPKGSVKKETRNNQKKKTPEPKRKRLSDLSEQELEKFLEENKWLVRFALFVGNLLSVAIYTLIFWLATLVTFTPFSWTFALGTVATFKLGRYVLTGGQRW